MTIIHIETSTNVCSVAASHNGTIIFEISNDEGLNHASMLSPFVQQALDKLKSLNLQPDAVAVSGGPGSYTGLRIGVSTAKGICYGFNIPLIAIDSLQLLAEAVIKSNTFSTDTLLCPMIDARRMEVYTALYSPASEQIQEVSAKIIDEKSFSDLLEKQPLIFFGNGSDKCKEVITHPNATFISHIVPLAENMVRLSEQKYTAGEFVDVAYYEPFYLKEFQTTVPKQKI